ncbi:hypothetical protein CC80DRAFT_596139 [Byssothecium circinans]|uniref:Uncharacterized protein n=1 Tax=Byssothecium circinans TaxID=147558 RepID=A0A6A5TMN5_9PLEO|nr:hypothetical protein CC80DRAFT_596139 [Byssothecium circinans]
MPRITPCRVLKVLLLPWIVMFGLWFFMPSFPIAPSDRNTYIQNALSAGQPIITAHGGDRSWEEDGMYHLSQADYGDGTHLGVRWQLATSKKGDGEVETDLQLSQTLLHLSQISSKASLHYSGNVTVEEKGEKTPYFTHTVRATVYKGETAHPYVMPWFVNADKVLFSYEFHGMTAQFDFTIIIPEPGVVQLWQRHVVAPVLKRLREKHGFVNYEGVNQEVSDTNPELVKAKMVWWETFDYLRRNHRTDGGLIAEFKDVNGAETGKFKDMAKVKVDIPVGDLTSRTFPIRRALIFPLGPTPMIISYALYSIYLLGVCVFWPYGLFASEIYVLFVLGRWLRAGRPGFLEWSMNDGLTRFWFSCCGCCIRLGGRRRARKIRRVWGPAGPLLDSEKLMGELDDVERGGKLDTMAGGIGLQRPVSAKLGNKKEWHNPKF